MVVIHEERHPLITFLWKFNVDQDELMAEIFPKIQEHILEAIRPSEEEILLWKNSVDGRKKFERYVVSKFTIFPTPTVVSVLWNKFSGKRVGRRDRKIIEKFIEIHMHCKKCEHCGTEEGKFHVDHIIPLHQGGIDGFSNLQFLCEDCNLRKSSNFDPFKSII